jgi:hypothetical protein
MVQNNFATSEDYFRAVINGLEKVKGDRSNWRLVYFFLKTNK